MKELAIRKRLTPDQAYNLEWLAAAYPGDFRDVGNSAAWNSLVRKGYATKHPAPGQRHMARKQIRLVDFRLTADGLRALARVNPELHARVDAMVQKRAALSSPGAL